MRDRIEARRILGNRCKDRALGKIQIPDIGKYYDQYMRREKNKVQIATELGISRYISPSGRTYWIRR